MLYFARDEATLLVKIGFSERDVYGRLRTLQTGCPGLLTLLGVVNGTKQDDKAWRKRFAAARVRGEWFRAVPELLQAIEDAKESQEEDIKRRIQKLQEELSGVKGWSDEEIEIMYLRMHESREMGEIAGK